MSSSEAFGVARRANVGRTWFYAQAVLIICLAVAIRAYAIGQQPLWMDELFSRYYVDLFGLKFLWTTGFTRENSPPLYYMAIAGWMHLFGTGEAAMRSLSLAASVLAMPLIYLIGKELFDQRHGLIAALIFALSPMQVSFAQEARTYALLLIPLSMSLLAIAHFLRGDTRPRVLCLYGVGTIIALYCHATAAFFIAACNIAVFAAIATNRMIDRRAAMIRWIGTNVVVALLAIPELVAMLLQGRHGAGLEWIPRFRPVDVVRALSPVISGTTTPDRFPGAELSLLLVATIVGALIATNLPRRAGIVLVAIPALFVALIAGISLLQPIFLSRVFCWLGVPLALLLAHVIVIPSRLRPVVVVVAAVTCVTGLFYQFTVSQKEPWRDVFDQIGSQLAVADDVVLAPMTDPTAFAYYAPYLTRLQMWDAGPHDDVENDDMPRRLGVHFVSRTQLIDEIRSGANVWLVLRTPDISYVNALLDQVPRPRVQIERSCGAQLCIAALSWPRPAGNLDSK